MRPPSRSRRRKFACQWSGLPLVGLGRPELESTMRSVPVVVIDVDVQDALEVPAVEDEHVGCAKSVFACKLAITL
jgi:hypothetical protein